MTINVEIAQTTKRKLPGGTVLEDLVKGNGPVAKKGQKVTLHNDTCIQFIPKLTIKMDIKVNKTSKFQTLLANQIIIESLTCM